MPIKNVQDMSSADLTQLRTLLDQYVGGSLVSVGILFGNLPFVGQNNQLNLNLFGCLVTGGILAIAGIIALQGL